MTKVFAAALLISVLLGLAGDAWAVQPDEILKDPGLEARARTISAELRCLVCQNQSIDDSDAPLARDLRVLVRERLRSGDSDPQVLQFLVDRYGDFILLKPRFGAKTYVLWIAPLLIFLMGVFLARRLFRAKGDGLAAPSALTAKEQQKLREIVDGNAGPRR
jgi:cytochrome c-type biogenesis protein CcmH